MATLSTSPSPTPTSTRLPLNLLSIPLETREQIFSYLLHPITKTSRLHGQSAPTTLTHKTFSLTFLLTCRQFHIEATALFHRLNTFILISTPFVEAEQWVSIHGSVPIIRIPPTLIDSFTIHHLHATISAPRFEEHHIQHAVSFVVLVEDLAKFTQHWFYTDVTNPGQNIHLRLTLALRNPHNQYSDHQNPSDEDAPPDLPESLQRKLLEPFGRIKDLDSFTITGPHSPSLERSVRTEQALPKLSARSLLESTTTLKNAGNEAFKTGNYAEALRLYVEAFKAMYIIIDGRVRSVWGDGTFQCQISGGMYDGEFAQQVRIVLRISLVANVVATYLKRGEYEEARFWGLRTIALVRQGMGAEPSTPSPSFPGSEGLGKIYFRTGVACTELGDEAEARRLLRIAMIYRPGDTVVAEALSKVALKLG